MTPMYTCYEPQEIQYNAIQYNQENAGLGLGQHQALPGGCRSISLTQFAQTGSAKPGVLKGLQC